MSEGWQPLVLDQRANEEEKERANEILNVWVGALFMRVEDVAWLQQSFGDLQTSKMVSDYTSKSAAATRRDRCLIFQKTYSNCFEPGQLIKNLDFLANGSLENWYPYCPLGREPGGTRGCLAPILMNKTIISDSVLVFSSDQNFFSNMYQPYGKTFFQDILVRPIGAARIYPLLPEVPCCNGKGIPGLGPAIREYWETLTDQPKTSSRPTLIQHVSGGTEFAMSKRSGKAIYPGYWCGYVDQYAKTWEYKAANQPIVSSGQEAKITGHLTGLTS